MIISINKNSRNIAGMETTNLPNGLNKHFSSADGIAKKLDNRSSSRRLTYNQQASLTKSNNLLGKITEIITCDEEASSLTMLLPLLATLSKDDRWFAWVSPPKNLPRSLLQSAGIALDKVMLLYPDEHNSSLMLAKKALSAGTCHAVISWAGDLSEHEMSNLEHSARIGASHGILIRKRIKLNH